MTDSISAARCARRYRGRTAETYTERRSCQRKWRDENEVVAAWLPSEGSVMDVPCGDGRFLYLYAKRPKLRVTALDFSEDMLAVIRARITPALRRRVRIERGDALRLDGHERHDVVLCVRLLHLLTQLEAGRALSQVCGRARRMVILTVRLAPVARTNASSATHPDRWFRSQVRRHGWRIAEEKRLSRQGWLIMRLERADADADGTTATE